MKIAFLFAGQYRPIPKDLIRFSIQKLTKGIDYDIFCYSWDEMGESQDHREEIPKIKSDNGSYKQISSIFSEFNLKEIYTESYDNFVINLPKKHKRIFNSKIYHKGTIFALPQIYTLSKCYKLLDNDKDKYDLIFRCRFDSIYLHPLNIYPLRKFLNSSTLYNINFGRAYYPNRIYDIFFGGSNKSMSFLDKIWGEIPQLVKNNLNNGQDKRDACRLFYVAAVTNKVEIKSFKTINVSIVAESVQKIKPMSDYTSSFPTFLPPRKSTLNSVSIDASLGNAANLGSAIGVCKAIKP